jgi:hypothetical protein
LEVERDAVERDAVEKGSTLTKEREALFRMTREDEMLHIWLLLLLLVSRSSRR